MHDQLTRAEPARVDLVAAAYSRSDGMKLLAHPLVLHPQRVDDVGLADLVERVG